MRYLDLCPDPASPRRVCRGRDCRCRANYRPRFASEYRRPGSGEVESMCRGCGRANLTTAQAVTGVTACVCGEEQRLEGTSTIRTILWRLFGRHEGYNAWDMWRTWLPSWKGPPFNRDRRPIQ